MGLTHPQRVTASARHVYWQLRATAMSDATTVAIRAARRTPEISEGDRVRALLLQGMSWHEPYTLGLRMQ